LDDI
jgi:hypothetical protein